MKIGLVFPHQLFEDHPLLNQVEKIYLIEEPLYFGTDLQYPFSFHQQKLVLHRASMQYWWQQVPPDLRGKYIPCKDLDQANYYQHLLRSIQNKHHLSCIRAVEPSDFLVSRRLNQAAKECQVKLEWLDSPNFYNSVRQIEDYFSSKKKLFQTKFYIKQRQQHNILITKDAKPLGGAWSFDPDNRKKLPKDVLIPDATQLELTDSQQAILNEATDYIKTHFGSNPGDIEPFSYPFTPDQATTLLNHFLEKKLNKFGDYQDALSTRNDTLFHSLLSSSLNIGLLNPHQVVTQVISSYQTKSHALNSVEGFLRQILGWREFVRGVYLTKGSWQRSQNIFNCTNKLHHKWYTGQTGLPPVDHTIQKIIRSGYAHHIERLMILGNCMLLLELDPDQVYTWFMELCIDSYDWVMVPNVYGMSQFADGGLMTTKPYITSSTYLLKMADAETKKTWQKANPNWTKIWDSLFWRFMHRHRTMLQKNARLGVLTKHLDRFSADKVKSYIATAEQFITEVTT